MLSRILVALDPSEPSRKAAAFAAALAARSRAELHLVHIAAGRVAREVVALADARGADLIVTGTRHAPGKRRLLDASVAGDILRAARGPVLVVPETARVPAGTALFECPLVAIDYGEASGAALRCASVVSGEASLDVLHVVAETAELNGRRVGTLRAARIDLEAWLERTLAEAAPRARGRVLLGRVPDSVADFVVGGAYDLVACGLRRHAISGCTSEALIDAATCPVLVVRTFAQGANGLPFALERKNARQEP